MELQVLTKAKWMDYATGQEPSSQSKKYIKYWVIGIPTTIYPKLCWDRTTAYPTNKKGNTFRMDSTVSWSPWPTNCQSNRRSKNHHTKPNKQFELETDALNFTLGAILFQCDEWGKRQAVGYTSRTLSVPEQNYNIWDKEFLGLIFGLTKWQHHLMCTKEPVLAFVDHANLAYYRHPQKINRRVARYISTLADYNLKIIHKPGTLNQADALSRRPDYDDGKDDNTNTTALQMIYSSNTSIP